MKNKSQKVPTRLSQIARTNWKQTDLATIYAGDLQQPWKSGYGFPMTAARLAAHQALVLHCREDEIFNLLSRLNNLVECPAALEQAYLMLQGMETRTFEKLSRLLQPVTIGKICELLAQAEPFLTESPEQTLADQLNNILAPDDPTREIAGLSKMLVRLQLLLPALERAKQRGFHVIVYDRRRQPVRPTLEARRDEPILLKDQPSRLTAGFLQPTTYHRSLWGYLVERNDFGQSAAWN